MNKWLLVSGGGIIVLLFFLFYPLTSALVFYEERSSTIAAYLPLNKGDHFQITFVHSIHRTDVVETYQLLEDGEIEQQAMFFSQFGIGMPSTLYEGESIDYVDGRYEVTGMTNRFPQLNIRNGKTVSQHRLSFWRQGESPQCVRFNDYFEPGAWFTVKVEKLSFFDKQKGVLIDDKEERGACRFERAHRDIN